jgi:CBS-domain-containing membrane protein
MCCFQAEATANEHESKLRVADALITIPKTHGPDARLEDIQALFENDHVHIALIVAPDGRLITTIERSDLIVPTSSATLVGDLGTLTGRVVGPSAALDTVTALLLREGRRRLAVVDDTGRLLGLLCLKKDRSGYCSDEGIRARANDKVKQVVITKS